MASARGLVKRAAFPEASTAPENGDWPANVLIAPPGVTRRIVWLLNDAVKTFPAESTATPVELALLRFETV
jgi:hypothetical protein